MKKIVVFLLGCAMLLLPITVFAEDINVYVGDAKVEFTDVQPVISEGRTLVPLRGVFEELGACVEWAEDERAAYINYKMTDVVRVEVDSERMLISRNGIEDDVVILDVPATILNDRIMVPLRAISEALECNVNWDQETKTASVSRVIDGVIDVSETNTVILSNGATMIVSAMYSQIDSDDEFAKKYNSLIKNYADNLLITGGEELLEGANLISGETYYLTYSHATAIDGENAICGETLIIANWNESVALLDKVTTINMTTSEVVSEQDYLNSQV